MSDSSINTHTHLGPHGLEQQAYRGETVVAFVLKPGIEASEATRQELLNYCKQELTAYKVPTILDFRASLPKSLIGKVIRRELRAGI
jgi:long-chain acyl-CoA synthetase